MCGSYRLEKTGGLQQAEFGRKRRVVDDGDGADLRRRTEEWMGWEKTQVSLEDRQHAASL